LPGSGPGYDCALQAAGRGYNRFHKRFKEGEERALALCYPRSQVAVHQDVVRAGHAHGSPAFGKSGDGRSL
jgi:hypothetical protein